MPSSKTEELKTLYAEMLSGFVGGLSNTSTKKFDPIKRFFSDWLQIGFDDIYATGAGTRPGNLEVRLSQGVQAIKHTKLCLAFLIDKADSESSRYKLSGSAVGTILKFLGRGKSHYDAILILIQGGQQLYVSQIVYRSREKFVDDLMTEFELPGHEIRSEEYFSMDEDEQSESDISNSFLVGKDYGKAVEEEEGDDEPLMIQPFNPSLINIDSKYLTIDLLIKRLSQDEVEIDLYPEFQRNANIWDETRQSRLIESILIRFPLPAFYFDGSNKNRWLVVDGLQRLTTIKRFVIEKNLRLTNLEFLDRLNGRRYDELSRDLQRIIEETQIVAYIINPGTPDDVKFNIFKRINTGGLVLVSQEIRHALYQGAPAKLIAELAESEEFKIATSGAIRTERMLDRDFANRFLSFYLFGYEKYTPDLDTFMSKAMAQVYKIGDEDIRQCKIAFNKSMRLNRLIFGQFAFRKIDGSGKVKPINKALFDIFSILFAKINDDQIPIVLERRERVINGLIGLLSTDEYFWASITMSTSDGRKVRYRFAKGEELLRNVISNDR